MLMFLTARQLQADVGRLDDAIGFVSYVVGRLNDEHGGTFRASLNVGNDPTLISVTGRWDDLDDYVAMRAAMAGDAELQSAVRVGSALFSAGQDTIAQIRREAGEPGGLGSFAVVNQTQMQLTRVAEAMAFAVEAADVVDDITGNTTGIATAVTGDRTRLMWFGFTDSLGTAMEDEAKCEASEDYIGLYKRSEEYFVPGTFVQNFWQMIT